MPGTVQNLRDNQPQDAPDAPGTPYSAWDYGHALARSGVAGLIGTGAYVVLHAVASHADKQANCQVGHACLARETGLSPAMVKRHLATLEDCGALGVHRYQDEETKKWAVNRYHIQPLEAIHSAPATQARKETAAAISQAHRAAQEGRVPNDPTPRVLTDPTPPRVPNDPTPRVLTDPRVGYPTTPKATPLSYPDKHAPPVPPVDISNNIETSARTDDSSNKQQARARADQSRVMSREQRVPTPLHQDKCTLDPEEPWLDEMVDVIHRRTGVYASREALKEWKAVLWGHLEGTTEGERDDFMAYIFDDPERYLEERRNSNEVRDTLQQDGAKWNARGRPRTKKRTSLGRPGARGIPSAADIEAQEDRGESCPECRKIPGARHSYDCPSGFAGQVVGQERKTS